MSLKALDQSWKMDGSYAEKPDIVINRQEQIAILQLDAGNLERERERLKALLSEINGNSDEKLPEKWCNQQGNMTIERAAR